ncbi:Phosphocarrier protein HPr [Buchnera aphidicola (Takecallis arundicolens)]|uniref:HPr family phosphocarrier protein n=1 Tax=Buchnera aphidicola TaxID=9 RepID=UPI0034641A12
MIQNKIKITSKYGLHIRPAAKFVKKAQKFTSDITVMSNGNSANAKSLFQLQTLDLTENTILTISANGTDEKEAVESLTQILAELK